MKLYGEWNSKTTVSFWINSTKHDLSVKVWDAPVEIKKNAAVIDLYGNDEIWFVVRSRETGRVVAIAYCLYDEKSASFIFCQEDSKGFSAIEMPR